ncbi:MAG: MlaD family protein [Limisphaerales bacterium]
MKEPGEERFKFRHVHAITGTFVLIVFGVLIAVLLVAGRSQRWFIGNVTLRIALPEEGAAGIRQGSEVYFLGTLVGTVSDVNVDAAGRMDAKVKIRRDFFLFVRADSSAVVKRKFGVIGDAYFEITRGHGEPLPEKNARIVCNEQLPSPLETAVAEIRREAVPALKKFSAGLDTWTTLGTNLIATQNRLRQVLTRADKVVAGLEEGKGTAGKLLTDSAVADELKTLLAQGNKSLDELQVTLKNVRNASRNLEDASRHFQIASTNLPAISDALADEAKDLPGLVLQTQTSMRELERLIEALQKQWPWRKHVNHTNPPPLRPAPINKELERTPAQQLPSPRKFER